LVDVCDESGAGTSACPRCPGMPVVERVSMILFVKLVKLVVGCSALSSRVICTAPNAGASASYVICAVWVSYHMVLHCMFTVRFFVWLWAEPYIRLWYPSKIHTFIDCSSLRHSYSARFWLWNC